MISPLVDCGARMSMAGRMSRTGPALKSKGGPGPCTTPGPVTGITSSLFHPLIPLLGWAWHCALAHWRAQTGAETGSGGGRGRQPGNSAPPPALPPLPSTAHNSPYIPATSPLTPKTRPENCQLGFSLSGFDRSAFPSICGREGGWLSQVGH